MKKFISLVLVFVAMLLQGCASTLVSNNSFGVQASRDVKEAMAHDMCPWGVQKQDIEVRSRVEISKDSNSQYRDNSVRKYEEYDGRTRAKCLPRPMPAAKKN